jgi:CRP-like cAMP-binding protein
MTPHSDPPVLASASTHPFAPASFLGLLSSRERAALCALGHRRRFPRGSVLLLNGDHAHRVVVLLAGRAKVTRLSEQGRETLLGILAPGDIAGELALIENRGLVGTVEAIEPVEAVEIATSLLRAHLERTPRVLLALLDATMARLAYANLELALFATTDTLGRLAARIVELAEQYGTRRGSEIEITLRLSQEELAAWAGASRAGVTKALQMLRDLRWIDTYRRRIVVRDLEALRLRAA